jgi:zinc protease
MISYRENKLSNGLTLITHQDKSTPLAVVNLLYKVGSRNEEKDKTGFAHLFEHLMFGGSANVSNFDQVLHRAGAENNAFTNTDITNYYIILNAVNLETALWVESDRMRYLTLDQKRLDIQKNVVVEEFKQRYLNMPYGDVWLKLRPLAYKKHPYQWPTIGIKPEHIQNADLQDVEAFYNRYYTPDNAVLSIAGNIDHEEILNLVDHWFGGLCPTHGQKIQLPAEPVQEELRFLEVESDVPMDAIYKVYHMPARGTKDYITADLASDLLGRGKSSRMYHKLVKKKKIFNSIQAYITGSSDPGLIIISGKLNPGQKIEDGDKHIDEEIELAFSNIVDEEVEKVINQATSSVYFSETELLNKAMTLALANSLGDTGLLEKEIEWMMNTTKSEILKQMSKIFVRENCSTLYYRSNQQR